MQSNRIEVAIAGEITRYLRSYSNSRYSVMHHIHKNLINGIVHPNVLLNEVLKASININDSIELVKLASLALRNGASASLLNTKVSKVHQKIDMLTNFNTNISKSPRGSKRQIHVLPEEMNNIAIYLDKPELLQIDSNAKYQLNGYSTDSNSASYILRMLQLCISTLSINCFNTLLRHLTDDTFVSMAWQPRGISLLIDAIKYSNTTIVTILLEYGVEPSFTAMNNALLVAEKCTIDSDRLKQSDANNIINKLIQYGFDLTGDDLTKYLSKIADLVIDSNISSIPYWKRICSTGYGVLSETLKGEIRKLAPDINVNTMSKEQGCSVLHNVDNAIHLASTPDGQFVCLPDNKECMRQLDAMLPDGVNPTLIRTRTFGKKVTSFLSNQ